MIHLKKLLLVLALGVFSLPSFADIYVGGGAYLSSFDIGGASSDDEDTATSIFIGYKPIPLLAIELGVYDLGEFTDKSSNNTLKASAYTLNGTLSVPLLVTKLYAKAGIARVETKGNIAGVKFDDSDQEGFYGAGIGMGIGPIDIYTEYLIFQNDIDDIHMLGLGARFEF